MIDETRIRHLGIAAAALPCALLLAWVSWDKYPIHCIYVYDADSQIPLSGVFVTSDFDPSIMPEASLADNGGKTDRRGRIEMRLPWDATKYSLTARFQNYEETTAPPEASIPGDAQTVIWMRRIRMP